MKKAFIVTSCIDVKNDAPLSYMESRSCFSSNERYLQTVHTLSSIDFVSDDETTVYLLDASDNWQEYASKLHYFNKNFKFVSVKEEFPEIWETVRTHPNKSHGECLMLTRFMKKYRQELKEYDYMFKMSGRYFLNKSFDMSLFNKYNTNKIFYKEPSKFEWVDYWNDWGFGLIDRRKEQGDNTLRQYCSVLFGWGRGHFDTFYDMFTGIAALTSQPDKKLLDIELFGYFFTRPYEKDIIETDWMITGWLGPDGVFRRY